MIKKHSGIADGKGEKYLEETLEKIRRPSGSYDILVRHIPLSYNPGEGTLPYKSHGRFPSPTSIGIIALVMIQKHR